MDEPKVKVKSLDKALRLLNCFTEQNTEVGVSAIAEQENLPKSTVHNIFSTFAAYGLLTQDASNGHYRLGPKVAYLSNIYFSTNSSFEFLRTEMGRVSSVANENVYYGTLFENQVLYLEAVYTSSMNRTSGVVGITAPLYCTGIGKSILAWSDPKIVDEIYANPVAKYTDNTITEKSNLKAELKQIREQGFAIDNMEHEYGVQCVSVPIFKADNTLTGAMSITCPSLRMAGKYSAFAGLLLEAQKNLRLYL